MRLLHPAVFEGACVFLFSALVGDLSSSFEFLPLICTEVHGLQKPS